MNDVADQSGTFQEQLLPSSLHLHVDKVLEAITASKEALGQKIETVAIDVRNKENCPIE